MKTKQLTLVSLAIVSTLLFSGCEGNDGKDGVDGRPGTDPAPGMPGADGQDANAALSLKLVGTTPAIAENLMNLQQKSLPTIQKVRLPF